MFLFRRSIYVLILSLVFTSSFAADNLKPLHSFNGDVNMENSYHLFKVGNKIFGTSYGGGDFNQGSLFTISNNESVAILYSYQDVSHPFSPITVSKDQKSIYGYAKKDKKAILYQLTLGQPNSLKIIHEFDVAYEWSLSRRSLVLSPDGNYLYGNRPDGYRAASNNGDIFRITLNDPSYPYEVLYNFKGGSDGSDPNNLIMSPDAQFLYGTTDFTHGRSDCGTIFRYSLHEQKLETIAEFEGCLIINRGGDRLSPTPNSLVFGIDGHLYGNVERGSYIFKVNLQEAKPKITTLYKFNGDFSSKLRTTMPNSLILSKDGCQLFGTTRGNFSYSVDGAIFAINLDQEGCNCKRSKDGDIKLLRFFDYGQSRQNGYEPEGLLLSSDSRTIYGSTDRGGAYNRGILFRYQIS